MPAQKTQNARGTAQLRAKVEKSPARFLAADTGANWRPTRTADQGNAVLRSRSPLGLIRATQARQSAGRYKQQASAFRQRLVKAEAAMMALKAKQEWLESALASQRQARQLLEATLSTKYAETVAQIQTIVNLTVPTDATILVVSKGDEQLLQLGGRRAWHFPRGPQGDYAGYHPTDSEAAIVHLQALIGKGAEFLLFPNTAFWWLEYYRSLGAYLEQFHSRVWHDDHCVIYRFKPIHQAEPRSAAESPSCESAPPEGTLIEPSGLYDVICFPIIDWDYRFQRPQQLMRQFAAAGHQVYYLSHQFRTVGESNVLRCLAENLREVSLRGSHFKIRDGVLDEVSRYALSQSLAALRGSCKPRATVSIIQSPFWWPIVRELAAVYAWPVIYDCLDHHAGFATSHPLLAEQERELLARADLVVASSVVLEAEARNYNPNVLLLRNACDYAHFAGVQPKRPGERPVIGYYGAIAEWFDCELVAALAERRPDWDFVLVGSTFRADVRRLSKLPNVSMPGEKPYCEIPGWLARFDVTILPFKRTSLTEATNPVKVYEIFAAGKPLVSVPLPESVLMVPLLRPASTVTEFEREIEAELRRPDPGLERKRRAFARDNTWQKRFSTLAPAIMRVCQSLCKAERPGAAPQHLDAARNGEGEIRSNP